MRDNIALSFKGAVLLVQALVNIETTGAQDDSGLAPEVLNTMKKLSKVIKDNLTDVFITDAYHSRLSIIELRYPR